MLSTRIRILRYIRSSQPKSMQYADLGKHNAVPVKIEAETKQ